jgi:tetratricopeptide (TPR) repeat protein
MRTLAEGLGPIASCPLMRLCLLHAVLAMVMLLTLAPRAYAQVDEQAEFEKGRNAYRAQQYDEADTRFRTMLDPQKGTVHDPVLVNQARMYWGAALFAKRRPAEASDVFASLLRSDRRFEPDPLEFPTEVVNAFIDTRTRVRDELNRAEHEEALRAAERKRKEEAERQQQIAYLAMLEDLAKKEKVIETHRRLIALVPFGAGQFQNGQKVLGWVFLTTELAFVLGGIVTVPIYYEELHNASSSYKSFSDNTVAQQYLDRANAARITNLAFYGAFALTAIVGVLHAQATYVPDVTTFHPRPLPQVPAGQSGQEPARSTHKPAAGGVPLWFGAAPLFGGESSRATGAVFGVGGRF